MVGPGSAADFAIMEAEAKRLGLEGRFRHFPKLGTEEVIEHMRRVSIYLLPTRMDTGPTSLKEALAMGLWPVCYDNSGPREYIRRFNYGSVAKDGDQEDLNRALAEAIRTQPWMDGDRREGVIRRVRHELGKECIWEQLIEKYGTIVRENPA